MFNLARQALSDYFMEIEDDESVPYRQLSGFGAIKSLEDKLRHYFGIEHALLVDSCTNGLMYLAWALGLEKSEIATTPLSYGATISGALFLKNKVHFADITDIDDSLNTCPDSLRKLLSKNADVKALIAVDFAGIPADMFALREICDEYSIFYISDAAQSFGAEIRGRKASTLADAFVLSFSAGKALYCGEGGAILTNDTDLYKRLVTICQHPSRIAKDVGIAASNELGLGGKINPLAAIIGNSTFDNCLLRLELKQHKMLEIYNELNMLDWVRPFCFSKKTLLPSFFYLPVVAENPSSFEDEFANFASNLNLPLGFKKANFQLLPEQMKRHGLSKAIKSCDIPNAYSILEKLYLLHFEKR